MCLLRLCDIRVVKVHITPFYHSFNLRIFTKLIKTSPLIELRKKKYNQMRPHKLKGLCSYIINFSSYIIKISTFLILIKDKQLTECDTINSFKKDVYSNLMISLELMIYRPFLVCDSNIKVFWSGR